MSEAEGREARESKPIPVLDGFVERADSVEVHLSIEGSSRPHLMTFGPHAAYQPLMISIGCNQFANTMSVDAVHDASNIVYLLNLTAAPEKLQDFMEALRRVRGKGPGKGLLVISGVEQDEFDDLNQDLFATAVVRGARPWLSRKEQKRGTLSMELWHGARFDGAGWASEIHEKHPGWTVTFKPGQTLHD